MASERTLPSEGTPRPIRRSPASLRTPGRPWGELPANRFGTITPMSLSSLLSAGRGPVWDWFVTYFPETRKVCTEANRTLRGGPATEPCAVLPQLGTDHGLVGTAVGYVLSAHLREDALDRTVATNGARLLARPLGRMALTRRPELIERAVVARVGELQPWRRALDEREWTELCQLMCILSRFEQYFRAGPPVLVHLISPLRAHSDDLTELAHALVQPPTLADVKAVGRAAVEDHASIRNASELFIGPTFAQSLALGGADADVIYDGTLLDFKSSAQAGVIKRHEAWQLLGYLFADTDDSYHIRQVGFAALRRRRTLTWPAQTLVDSLAGHPTLPIDQWRTSFVELLKPLAAANAERSSRRIQAKLEGRRRSVDRPATKGDSGPGP
jgi:hypothetical protein